MEQGFKLGKAYQHHSGSQLYICGMMDGILHGKCFIAENGYNRELLQISQHKWDFYVPKEGEIVGPRPGSSGWGETYTPVSMAPDATQNYFEIPVEEFIRNNTSK